MEVLEQEDLVEYREAYERELYRFDEDGNRRTNKEIEDYLWEKSWLAAFEEDFD
jgi:hypothetical protein